MSLESAGSARRFKMRTESMDEEQTVAFLTDRGVRPFDALHWEPGDPLLVVFRESLREKIGAGLARDRVPSIVRLGSVTKISIDTVKVHNSFLNAQDCWLNYFAINPRSGAVVRSKDGYRKSIQYFIEGCHLYMPDDTLFVPWREDH